MKPDTLAALAKIVSSDPEVDPEMRAAFLKSIVQDQAKDLKPSVEPINGQLFLTQQQAATLLGVSRWTFKAAVDSGEKLLQPVPLFTGIPRYSVSRLREYIRRREAMSVVGLSPTKEREFDVK